MPRGSISCIDPVHCPVGSVLEFMQESLPAGLSPAILKVYVTAVSACHIHIDGAFFGVASSSILVSAQ